jgi:hypothetical protein
MRHAYIIVLTIFFVSCTNFKTPQPVGENNIEKFPETLIGRYYPDSITKNDTINKIDDLNFITIKDDSLIIQFKDKNEDTSISYILNKDLILRKKDNLYVFNIDFNGWNVILLDKIDDKNFDVYRIKSDLESIKKIKAITAQVEDDKIASIPLMQITTIEFDKIIKNNLFEKFLHLKKQ